MRCELQACYINCKLCCRYSVKNSKGTLITRPVLEYPFQRIGLSTMILDRRKYLVYVDYFYNYTMVDRLQGILSGFTVKLIRKHLMRYCTPEVVCDGGAEFNDRMMKELAHWYGFKWNPSSPEMPNSNGMAESAVKQIKYIIRKCNNENGDPCVAKQKFSNTSSKSTGISPTQRFFEGQMKSVLSTNEDIPIPI